MDKLGESLAKLNDTLVKHVPKGYTQVIKEYQGKALMSLVFTLIVFVIVLALFILMLYLAVRTDSYDGSIDAEIIFAIVLFIVGICLVVHIHTCLARMISPNYQFLSDLINKIT